MHEHHRTSNKSIWRHPVMLTCVIAGLLALGYWLYAYHWGHVLGLFPYLILLACPLMHIFMMKGHHHNKSDD